MLGVVFYSVNFRQFNQWFLTKSFLYPIEDIDSSKPNVQKLFHRRLIFANFWCLKVGHPVD